MKHLATDPCTTYATPLARCLKFSTTPGEADPDDAPGGDCPDHGPYADDECPKDARTLLFLACKEALRCGVFGTTRIPDQLRGAIAAALREEQAALAAEVESWELVIAARAHVRDTLASIDPLCGF